MSPNISVKGQLSKMVACTERSGIWRGLEGAFGVAIWRGEGYDPCYLGGVTKSRREVDISGENG